MELKDWATVQAGVETLDEQAKRLAGIVRKLLSLFAMLFMLFMQ